MVIWKTDRHLVSSFLHHSEKQWMSSLDWNRCVWVCSFSFSLQFYELLSTYLFFSCISIHPLSGHCKVGRKNELPACHWWKSLILPSLAVFSSSHVSPVFPLLFDLCTCQCFINVYVLNLLLQRLHHSKRAAFNIFTGFCKYKCKNKDWSRNTGPRESLKAKMLCLYIHGWSTYQHYKISDSLIKKSEAQNYVQGQEISLVQNWSYILRLSLG